MKKSCPDCGSAPTIHFLEKFDSIITVYFLPILAKVDILTMFLVRLFTPKIRRRPPLMVRIFLKLKIGSLIFQPDEKVSGRALCFWEEAKRRGVKMYDFRLFQHYSDHFLAEYKGEYIFFEGLPRPKGNEPPIFSWMDNKAEMNKRFSQLGLPVAKSGVAHSLKQALQLFTSLPRPLIAKPIYGSRSRHTTIHIDTKEEMKVAFLKARELCPWVEIEEELVGMVHRGTVIGGKLVGVLRREPAYVIADGAHNIRQLIEEENKNPLRKGPLFHEIILDDHVFVELKRQGLDLESVPAFGQIVLLGTKTSRGVGGGITDLTEETHPDNKELFEKVAKIFDDSLIGIDFIIRDISHSWKTEPKCGIIECNSLPFIDLHHHPLKGQPRNVAGALWDLVFPTSASR